MVPSLCAWYQTHQCRRTKIGILIEHNLGWLYTGIVLLKLLQIPIGTILGEARKASKVAVPDQHVYRVMGSEGYQVKAWLCPPWCCPWRVQPCSAGPDELIIGIPHHPCSAVRCGQLGLYASSFGRWRGGSVLLGVQIVSMGAVQWQFSRINRDDDHPGHGYDSCRQGIWMTIHSEKQKIERRDR